MRRSSIAVRSWDPLEIDLDRIRVPCLQPARACVTASSPRGNCFRRGEVHRGSGWAAQRAAPVDAAAAQGRGAQLRGGMSFTSHHQDQERAPQVLAPGRHTVRCGVKQLSRLRRRRRRPQRGRLVHTARCGAKQLSRLRRRRRRPQRGRLAHTVRCGAKQLSRLRRRRRRPQRGRLRLEDVGGPSSPSAAAALAQARLARPLPGGRRPSPAVDRPAGRPSAWHPCGPLRPAALLGHPTATARAVRGAARRSWHLRPALPVRRAPGLVPPPRHAPSTADLRLGGCPRGLAGAPRAADGRASHRSRRLQLHRGSRGRGDRELGRPARGPGAGPRAREPRRRRLWR